MRAAAFVFAFHLLVIAFNVFGLIVIPIGAWRRWAFVRVFWWRALHIALLAVVAVQAALGRACFLTDWQADLEGTTTAQPMIQNWVETLVHWPLPIWAFALM